MRGFFILCLLVACQKNHGTTYESPTVEQEAEALMNDGDYNGAIALLEPVVAGDPEGHARKPLLAAAYAASIGVDLIGILKKALTSDSGESTSVFEQIASFLPEDSDEDDLATLKKAVTILESIPEDQLGTDGDPKYGISAEFQLVLYRTIYATLLLEVLVGISENIDLDRIRNLSDAEILEILNSLAGAAGTGNSAAAEALSENAAETLAAIRSSEGSTDQERLANYMENR